MKEVNFYSRLALENKILKQDGALKPVKNEEVM
jgi:hypothetical protein